MPWRLLSFARVGVKCGASNINRKDLLILFAKSPHAGDVKTRLTPILSKKERALLQEALILDTLSLTASLSVTRALACTPNTEDQFFGKCAKEHAVLLVRQDGDDLGERMKNGFYWAFSQGFQRVVIIGSDAPTLPISFIKEAFNQIKTMPIVLGPAIDGGYYLIGTKWPLPDIFTHIRWGSNTVLSDTIARLRRYHLLPFWYDIDYPKDMVFLMWHIALLAKQRGVIPVETVSFLKGYSGSCYWSC